MGNAIGQALESALMNGEERIGSLIDAAREGATYLEKPRKAQVSEYIKIFQLGKK